MYEETDILKYHNFNMKRITVMGILSFIPFFVSIMAVNMIKTDGVGSGFLALSFSHMITFFSLFLFALIFLRRKDGISELKCSIKTFWVFETFWVLLYVLCIIFCIEISVLNPDIIFIYNDK